MTPSDRCSPPCSRACGTPHNTRVCPPSAPSPLPTWRRRCEVKIDIDKIEALDRLKLVSWLHFVECEDRLCEQVPRRAGLCSSRAHASTSERSNKHKWYSVFHEKLSAPDLNYREKYSIRNWNVITASLQCWQMQSKYSELNVNQKYKQTQKSTYICSINKEA